MTSTLELHSTPAADLGARWAVFAGLYGEHIAIEESRAYPAARLLLGDAAQAEMGQEMARRRGAR